MTAFFFLIEVFIGYFTALCFYAMDAFLEDASTS